MNYFLFIACFVVSIGSCDSTKKISSVNEEVAPKYPTNEWQESLIALEYEALSRGSFLHIKVNDDLVKKFVDRNLQSSVSKKCAKKDWQEIMSLVKTIDLEKINDLKPPTDKRLYDGALHAQLKIILKNKTYTSISFDHGHPPKEIASLVNTMLSLAESIENQ